VVGSSEVTMVQLEDGGGARMNEGRDGTRT